MWQRIRTGEDTDNSKYYSNVSQSEALNAKDIMENSEKILKEVRLYGVYTAFHVDFETGEVEYVSPSFKFNVNDETGELDAIGQTYTFYEEISRLVREWLETNGVVLSKLQDISETHTVEIDDIKESITLILQSIDNINENIKALNTKDSEIKKNLEGYILWENPDASVAFPAQTVYADTTNYVRFVVLASEDKTNDMENVPVTATVCYEKQRPYYMWYHTMTEQASRRVTVTDAGFYFTTCEGTWDGSDGKLIPLKIIGYK